MCKFCLEHGEGKKWYLQTKNYAEELLNEERRTFITNFYVDFERNAAKSLGRLDTLIANRPNALKLATIEEQLRKDHAGQVLPLEEVEEILGQTTSIVRIPCACRSALLGRYDSRFCLGITTFKSDFLPQGFIEGYPDYAQGLEIIDTEEAIRQIRRHDENGLIHTVWTFISPFIGSLCNCTTRDCVAFRMRLALGPRIVYKGESVAKIDIRSCNGCRDCLKRCPFGAITYSASVGRCFVNQLACYGCGVCRPVCSRDAVSLVDRSAIPLLAEEW